MQTQHFLREQSYYQRDMDPLSQYIQQATVYLSKMTGDTPEQCLSYLKNTLRPKDPQVKYFHRPDGADREVDFTPLSTYISSLVKDQLILAPTFTCYKNHATLPSKLVGFVSNNKTIRSKAKKSAFKAKAGGNLEAFMMDNNKQNNMKTYNNSMSGAFGSAGSVLHNPTAHNTLTSTIRSVSSFGNASNERVVMGNRHYYSEDIVITNLNAYCTLIDRDEISHALAKYNLAIPSIVDVMATIKYSTDFYFQCPKALTRIRTYVEKMDDIERAAFCYIGDLYHIRVFNDQFMRDFISALSQKITGYIPDALEHIHSIDEQILNYAHQIGYFDLRGRGKDYPNMPYETVCMLVLTSRHIEETLDRYQGFITAFFLTKMIPASHAYIRSMIRRSVVLSDTDSTCFSTDDWMQWYMGRIHFSDETFAVCGAVAYIANQTVMHLLALLSANIGTSPDMLHSLAMKNEFLWTLHMPTNVAKHYAAWTVVQEGNVFKEPSLEIKGVHLKNSAAPPDLMSKANTLITDILSTTTNNQSLSLKEIIDRVLAIETDVSDSLRAGHAKYLKRSKIKDASAYSLDATQSPYQHYQLWLDAYQYAYGPISPPPYGTLIVPTILVNKTLMNNWVSTLANKDMAKGLSDWIVAKKKNEYSTIYLPQEYVDVHGVPPEIRAIMDIRKITLDLTLVYRLILDSLGFFSKPDLLLSEQV